MKRWRLLLAAVLALALLGAYAWYRLAPRETPAGQPPLVVLETASFISFERAFNDSSDHTRLLVLLSPT